MRRRRGSTATAPPAATTPEEAAAHFKEHGLFWMRDVLTTTDLEKLRSAAAESFNECARMLLLKQALGDAADACKHAELMERDGARFDCRHGVNQPPLSTLLRPDGPAATLLPSLTRCLGQEAEVVALGQIVAVSLDSWVDMLGDRVDDVLADGADASTLGTQRWHADGPADSFAGSAGDALTLFIPLVELTPSNGATSYHLGSHTDAPTAPPTTDDHHEAEATTLYLPAGSAVAFGTRLCFPRPQP